MAQFTNTKKINTIENITQGFKERLNSPYIVLQDKKPYVVDYWSQSLENSTSDEASNLIYNTVGTDTPVRFNKIQDGVMYGLSQFLIDLETNEFGLSATGYSGESDILPNTWVPVPGDYFLIKHADLERLFVVTDISPNTLPNGANSYQVQFEYSAKTVAEIEKCTINRYRFIMGNVGTQFSPIIKCAIYDDIAELEKILDSLKIYYNNIFFQDRVQTYVYNYNFANFYDPYMIEFLKRNSILNRNRDFSYIAHALPVHKTFSIDYDKTFLRTVELGDIGSKFRTNAVAQFIDNKLSLFYGRSTDYFKIEYNMNTYADEVPIVNLDLVDRIKNNKIYDVYNSDTYKNIIIKYFNHDLIDKDDIKALDEIDYCDNIDLYYNIPIIIFILEYYIKESLKTNKDTLKTFSKTVYE